SDARVRRAARRVLEDLSEPDKSGMGWVFERDHGASCFVGNVVRYVAMAGYGADARIEPLVQRLVRESRKHDAACVINGDDPCAWGYARLIWGLRSEEHTSELQSRENLVCRLLLEKK